MYYARIITFCSFLLALTGSLNAEPFIPDSEDTVLESISTRNIPIITELKKLETRLKKNPQNLDLTIELFGKYMQQSSRSGDPYFSGRAEALLVDWLKKENIPPSILIARATVRQYNHDFDGALSDADLALVGDPGNIQARLLRSNIYRIKGRYTEARKDCLQLALKTDPVVVSVCQLSVSIVSGKAEWASQRLVELIDSRNKILPENVREWAYTVLTEALSTTGKSEQALKYLNGPGANLKNSGIHLQAAYLDLLLQSDRYQDAYNFLSEANLPDILLLRKAIAAQHLKRPDAAIMAATLKARFADSKRAGRESHFREEALYELHLTGNADKALNLALDNWKQQKELIDTRILLEAILLSGKYEQAQPVIKWVEEAKNGDVRITQMIKQIKKRVQ